MDKIIKNVLKKIESNGFEAYIVGGYVRDCLLGINSYDVDICTNALPKDLCQIFDVHNSKNNYGSINIKIKKYNFDITTYRKELKYENRRPTEIEYINNLIEDVKRRDFSINAICMDFNMNIIDLVNGVEDINNRIIRMIGDIDEKIVDDPLRILRAIRFATINNFEIEEKLYQKIKEKSYLVDSLSTSRIKNELNKILLSPNYKRGLELLEDAGLLEILKISYEEIFYVNDINGMWAQLNVNKDYQFTKQEKEVISKIKELVEIGKINNQYIYKYGLYISQVAGAILGIKKKDINNMFNKMPLTNPEELDIRSEEIIKALDLEPSKKIKEVTDILIEEILNKKLKNNKKEIKKYLNTHREELLK